MIENRRYILVTPCRDEASYLQTTIDSIVAQTVLPKRWIIIDDGSTDDTPKILERAARDHSFITVIRREDRGIRRVGPGVIDAFYAGLETANLDEIDFICKFDADLELPSDYFEQIIERMEAAPRIGTCSGKPYFRSPAGELISEKCGDEMSVGMIKFYRVQCFKEIGGFVREVMWDGIDCHRCRMQGWIACSWDEPSLRFIHLRPMGSSHRSIVRGRIRHGFGQWFMGTGLLYMTASALYRMMRPPLFVGGASMWWGYVRSMLKRESRYDDREFRRFLRRYQRNCLLRGKQEATARLNAEQEKVWRGSQSINRQHEVATT